MSVVSKEFRFSVLQATNTTTTRTYLAKKRLDEALRQVRESEKDVRKEPILCVFNCENA